MRTSNAPWLALAIVVAAGVTWWVVGRPAADGPAQDHPAAGRPPPGASQKPGPVEPGSPKPSRPAPAPAPAPGATPQPPAPVAAPADAPATPPVAPPSTEPVAKPQPPAPVTPRPRLPSEVTYRDGPAERRMHVRSSLLFEFRPRRDPARPPTPPVPGAQVVRDEADGRIWRLPQGSSAEDAIDTLRTEGSAGLYSPVFADAPSDDGVLRALPGGVQLQFPPAWDRAQVEAWAAERKLTGLQKLTVEPNWYLVESEPGQPALALAQALSATGELVTATPNVWSTKSLR